MQFLSISYKYLLELTPLPSNIDTDIAMPSKSFVSFRFWHFFAVLGLSVVAFQFGMMWQAGAGERKPSNPNTVVMPGPTNRTDRASPNTPRTIRAEYSAQSALLIGANDLIRYHQSVFKEMVKAVHGEIPIIGFVNSDDEADLGQDLLAEAGLPCTAVNFIKQPLDSMWIRDYGPHFARGVDGTVKIQSAVYKPDVNQAREHDGELSSYIGRVLNLEVESMPIAIEGGNLLVNGDGMIVTSTRVLERPENRSYTLQQIGNLLQTHLGCRLWVYLKPLAGEPTGHIDFCLTFLRRNLVVVGKYDKAYDPVNAELLDRMAQTLTGQPTTMGPLVVERIPMPPRTKEGDWLSYCNILLINGTILMPSFTGVDPALESAAKKVYARLMPSWKIVTINSDTLVKRRGVLHCVGITVPAYVNALPLISEAM